MKTPELNWIFSLPSLSIFGPLLMFLSTALLFRIYSESEVMKLGLTQKWFRITFSIFISVFLALIIYPATLLWPLLYGLDASFKDIALGMGLTAILWGIGSYAGITLATYIFGLKKENK
jgi:hypothetical protein